MNNIYMLIFTVLCTSHFNPFNHTTCVMKLFPLKMTTGLFEHVWNMLVEFIWEMCV